MVYIAKITVKPHNSRDAPQKRNGAIFWAPSDFILPEGFTPLSKNEDVLRCIHIIADRVSNMTIMLMQNGKNGDIRIKDALAKKIDIRPYSLTTRKSFVYNIVKDYCIHGNKVVFPYLSSRKEHFIEDLVPWSADSVSFANKTERSYQIVHNGKTYNQDEVLHFVMNPSNSYPYIGEGIAPNLRKTVSDLAQAQATKSAFLKSKWKPSLIISTMSDAEELEDKEKRKNILNSYTETSEAGEPWLIPAGEIDVKTVQPLTLNDLAISDSITLDKKSIAVSCGVPPFMLGVGNFNKDEYNNFIQTTILSHAMIVQQELTRGLLYAPDRYFKLNIDSLMQYSMQEIISQIKEMTSIGVINRNEGRNKLNLSPVDHPSMNEYTQLENYIPVDKLGKQKKLIQGGDNDGTPNDNNIE